MKTQFTEQSERKLLSEFDPALIFMHWVYVLKNRTNGEIYYGYTNNLERRLKEHNLENKWKFIACEGYVSELDARDREKKLKHYGQARTHLRSRLKRSLEL